MKSDTARAHPKGASQRDIIWMGQAKSKRFVIFEFRHRRRNRCHRLKVRGRTAEFQLDGKGKFIDI